MTMHHRTHYILALSLLCVATGALSGVTLPPNWKTLSKGEVEQSAKIERGKAWLRVSADVRPPENQWTGSWASAQQAVCDQSELGKHSFEGATLRETVHLSLGGSQIRLRLSNLFGNQPLLILSMAVAHARPGMPGAIDIKSSVPARFNGATTVTVAPGAEVVSDNIPLSVQSLSDLAVSLTIGSAPKCATSHPGARATAFLVAGDHVTDESLTGSESFVHWYFLSAVEVSGGVSNGAVAVLGDSITDGHGATSDGNDRWTDVLAARLAPRKISVLLGQRATGAWEKVCR